MSAGGCRHCLSPCWSTCNAQTGAARSVRNMSADLISAAPLPESRMHCRPTGSPRWNGFSA
eukprot:3739651-Pyramimonas_sp.AAC.1